MARLPRLKNGASSRAASGAEFVEKRAEFHRIEKILMAIDRKGLAECPTCGTPVKDLKKHIAELRAMHDALTEALTPLNDARNHLQAYDLNKRNYDVARTKYRTAKEALEAELASLPETKKGELDTSQYLEVVRDYQDREKQLKESREKYETLRRDEHAALVRRTELKASKQTLTDKEAKTRVSPDRLNEANDALAAERQLQSQLSELRGSRKSLKAAQEAAQSDLEAALLIRSRAATAQQWLDYLELVREVMHHTQLPRRVANGYLGEITDRINENLEDFHTPFVVRTSDDLGFMVRKGQGAWRPADALSGGELVVLASAFRGVFTLARVRIEHAALDPGGEARR